MGIFVRTLAAKLLPICAEPADTIYRIKRQIHEKEKIPSD